MRNIRLLFTFYSYFALASLLITLCCVWLVWQTGFEIMGLLVVFKLLTLAVTYAFVQEYKKRELYYFYNFGFSKLTLFAYTFSFDFLLFVFSFTLLIAVL